MGVLVFIVAHNIAENLAVMTGFARFTANGRFEQLPEAMFVMAIAGAPLALLGYWLLVHVVGGRPVIELCGRWAALRELAVGLAIGALLMSAVIAVLALLGSYHMADVGWSTGILAGLGAGVFAGFTEEIFFRGILLRLIEGWVGTWWALAITAVFFGAAHLGNPQATVFGAVAIALEAGILLGACYLLTRRLWLAIGVHIAWNFVQGGIFGSDISGMGTGRGLIEARFTGPDLLTGGSMGIEASVVGHRVHGGRPGHAAGGPPARTRRPAFLVPPGSGRTGRHTAGLGSVTKPGRSTVCSYRRARDRTLYPSNARLKVRPRRRAPRAVTA